jgi:hypothetical protein
MANDGAWSGEVLGRLPVANLLDEQRAGSSAGNTHQVWLRHRLGGNDEIRTEIHEGDGISVTSGGLLAVWQN